METQRFQAIDGLRGVAILMVLMLHAWAVNHSPWRIGPIDLSVYCEFGRSAVSLFFAISGFCLYYPIVSRPSITPNWPKFYWRRVVRIVPAFVVAVFVWSLLRPHEATAYQIVTHLLFLHPLFDDAVFGLDVSLWSLGVEWHFYLLLPLLAFLFSRHRFAVVLCSAALSIGLQYAIAYHFDPHTIAYMHLSKVAPARIIEFVAGMAAARAIAAGNVRRIPLLWMLGLGGLLIGPFIHRAALSGNNWWWGDVLFAPCWFALIVAAVASPKSAPARFFGCAPLRWLGVISYSVYLYNGLMYALPEHLPSIVPGSSIWWISGLAAVLLAGIAGYYLTEKPFIALRARLRNRPSPTVHSGIYEILTVDHLKADANLVSNEEGRGA